MLSLHNNMYSQKNIDNMSRQELINTIILLNEENNRIKNEIAYFQNRNFLGLSPYNILYLNEVQELKSRVDNLSTEIQILKEEKK